MRSLNLMGTSSYRYLDLRLVRCVRLGLHDDFHRISYEWKRLGFQREDPISDIRGGGVVSRTTPRRHAFVS